MTAIRTAAVSGVATRLLARPDAGDLAIIGAGTQARTHLEAMLAVRPIRRVRVFSLPLAGAHAFAERETRRHGIPVEVMDSARAAVEGADLICTVTSAREPVVLGEWLAPGAHINAVGAFTPTTRELDTAAVAKSRLYVDRRQSTLNEAGEFIIAKAEGAIGDDHIVAELGELLLGQVARPRFDDGDHPVQVAGHRHRRPGCRASHLAQGRSDRRRDMGGDRRPALRVTLMSKPTGSRRPGGFGHKQ